MAQPVQTHFPPTVMQPLDYKSPMPPVTVVSVSKQTTSAYTTPFYLSETDLPNPAA